MEMIQDRQTYVLGLSPVILREVKRQLRKDMAAFRAMPATARRDRILAKMQAVLDAFDALEAEFTTEDAGGYWGLFLDLEDSHG